jgi:hypothetical protein
MAKQDKSKLVTGFFKTRAAAERAFESIVARGYTAQDMTVVMSDSARNKEFVVEPGTKTAEGAGIGGAVGGVVGATLAAIVAAGAAVAVPGLGLVVAGPLAAALAGAGVGGATGSLIGMLVGAGIPEHQAKVYEAGIKQGGILLGVEVYSDAESKKVEQLLEEVGAETVREH